MFRKLKKREGFTLIELMMVVAVIGILAAVLVPRIGGSKDNARLTGVESNARAVQAIIEGSIARQTGTAGNAAAFATTISTACTGITNPFTSAVDGTSVTAAPAAQPTAAVIIINDGDAPPAANAIFSGSIFVTFTITNNIVTTATITAYDGAGAVFSTTTVNR